MLLGRAFEGFDVGVAASCARVQDVGQEGDEADLGVAAGLIIGVLQIEKGLSVHVEGEASPA